MIIQKKIISILESNFIFNCTELGNKFVIISTPKWSFLDNAIAIDKYVIQIKEKIKISLDHDKEILKKYLRRIWRTPTTIIIKKMIATKGPKIVPKKFFVLFSCNWELMINFFKYCIK